MNWAFRVKYNPASEAKLITRNKAEIIGFGRVIIKTAVTAQIVANIIKRIISSDISPSMENGRCIKPF